MIDQVHRAWGTTIRDGFGMTETTLQVANTPGQKLVIGSMGRALPGMDVVLIDPRTGEHRESNADMATKAARRALDSAGLVPEDIDGIILIDFIDKSAIPVLTINLLQALPKTRSGKIMRRLLTQLHQGTALGDTTSLQNEPCVGQIAEVLRARRRAQDAGTGAVRSASSAST